MNKNLKDRADRLLSSIYIDGYEHGYKDAIQNISNYTPKIGHWIVHPKGIYAHLICDKCLSNAPYNCRTNYCANCGCRMVEPQESEES